MINEDEIDFDILVKLACMSYELLQYDGDNINRDDVLSIYKNLLYEKGFMTIGYKVHQNELYYEFTRFYGEKLLNLFECNIDFHNENNWLKVITRKSNRTSHPLRHLLLINFLVGDIDIFFSKLHKTYNPFGQGPWPCLNKAANHYRRDIIEDVIISKDSKAPVPLGTFICSCGFIYARKGPDKSPDDRYKIGKTKAFGHVWTEKLINLLKEEKYSSRQLAEIMGCDANTIRKKASELNMNYFSLKKVDNSQNNSEKQRLKSGLKIEEYKNKVQDFIESNKSIGKLKLMALMPNEIRYICKYDKGWINCIFPIHEFHDNKKGAKIDWNKRDSIYVSLVKDKYKEMYNRVPYQRITKSAIGTELGIRNMLYNHAEKLPNTMQFIHSKQESVEQFRIRRCNNTIKTFIDNELPVRLWKVIRLAGINSDIFMEIKDMIYIPEGMDYS